MMPKAKSAGAGIFVPGATERVRDLLAAAWAHDALTALKLACNLRGVRGTGKSDKEGFYAAALWMHANHPKTLACNVAALAEFGYLKDFPELLFRLIHGPDVRKAAKENAAADKARRKEKDLSKQREGLRARLATQKRAIDVYCDKIRHLVDPPPPHLAGRISFHRLNIKNDSRLEGLIKMADLTINLAAICTPADYNTRPLDTIYSNFIDALPVVKYCSENSKRLIHFSTCEVYGKTIGSFLPKDHPLRKEPEFFVLTEDESPCIFGPILKQRWSYACAKQLIERLIFAEGAENDLEFTIVRPFNWIGPRMDFIPGVDGPSEGVPRVLACFSNNLLRREPLKLVDGGEVQRTFLYIKDAIEAVVLMIENPARANGHIFNVGNPNNEVTVRELAELMTEVYANVSGEPPLEEPVIDVSAQQFYGEGYDDSDKRIPSMTLINKQLGWNPKTPLKDLLETTLTYQHKTYKEAVKTQMSQASASS